MLWIFLLAVVAFLLLFAGLTGVLLAVRRYRRRSERNRAMVLAEMMKIKDKAEENKE